MQTVKTSLLFIGLFTCFLAVAQTPTTPVMELMDVFELEYVSDPQISPDGKQIVYVRNFKDVMTDGNRSNLWIINFDGTNNRPLTTGNYNDRSPRWSPDGQQLLYISNRAKNNQFYIRWMDTGAEAKVSNFTKGPSNPRWSPDGKWVAFTMSVDTPASKLGKLPKKPKGAKWVEPPVFIDKMKFKSDGAGFLKSQYRHLFMMSAEGGFARQLTSGDFNHGGNFCWSPDSKALIFSANRNENHEYEPRNSEIYELTLQDGSIAQLTKRFGPDSRPAISPDGKVIAYTGYDDRFQGYQVDELYVMNRDGSKAREISASLDRDVDRLFWSADSKQLYIQYDDKGNTKLASIDLQGKVTKLADNVGGLSLGRPYAGGTFNMGPSGKIAFTHSTPDHPADLAVLDRNGKTKRLTQVNADLFGYKQLGKVKEIWTESTFDGRQVQGWICTPPNFDPAKKYPLLLEIHGGPFANYGDRFSAEVQLYAAAGYVVLYTNPRGSTSYGEEFGNLIHHNYPGQDYDDLISLVDVTIKEGYVDPEQLFVTGGSGGGVLTAWIVGKTDRFKAAVVAKPVINWYSFVLHADNPATFYKYWFPGFPWEHTEHYMKRSPISLVGNVKTPTMLLTGEQDYRTPMSETEQYYTALQLNKVETALVRIQESGHGIARRPSNLMAKVGYILNWFEKYK